MAQAGLHEIGTPPSYGGGGVAPRHQVEIIEAISYVDGATGWNLMIGVENKALMALQWRQGAALIQRGDIMCGSTAVVNRAEAVGGGWLVRGQWPWVSGCHNADWFGGQVHAFRGDEQITPRPVYAFARRGDFEIIDTWRTAGMRGSGSHDVKIDGLVVPDDHISFYDQSWVREQREMCVLARLPLGVRLAHNKTAVALGIARAALDVFTDLGSSKVPAFGSARLAERPYSQLCLATAESRVRSGRAWVMEVCDHAWGCAVDQTPMTDREKALFLLACADATAGCVEAVESSGRGCGNNRQYVVAPAGSASSQRHCGA